MSSKKQVFFAPLQESVYLARPAKSTSPIALQVQRVDTHNGFVEPVFDVKANARPMTKLLKKVRSINDAVVSIIPEPPISHYHHHSRKHSTGSIDTPLSIDTSTLSSSSFNNSAPKSPTNDYKPARLQTFSIFDRDSSEREPVALLSRCEVNFSTKATPLLARSSRLGRITDDSTHLSGEVTWLVVPEFSKSKVTSFKVVDHSTSKTIGRWKRRSTLSNSELSQNDIQLGQPESQYGPTASNRYYSEAKSTVLHPFFSGEAYSFANASAKIKEEWCFVVTKRYTKNGQTSIRRSVIATLKGYEFRIVDSHDSTLRNFYLDEYVRHLRHKVQRSFDDEDDNSSLDDVPTMSSNSSIGGRQYDSVNIHRNSTFCTPKVSNKDFTFSDNFYRLRLNDGMTMMAMALLLNLDDMIMSGMRNSSLTLSSSLSNGSSTFSDNYNYDMSSPPLSPSLAPVIQEENVDITPRRRSSGFRGSSVSSSPPRRMSFMNPLNIFRKEPTAPPV